ncbi:MAG: tripartite tricarboxylate transporter permease [Paracoccaceae bacterium]
MLFDTISQGFGLFASPLVFLLIFAGIIFGLLVGAMPGLGPLMGMVLILPVAINLEPITAMALLLGIYVGGSCGGSISAILLRIPGTPLAAATLFDGYPMAQKGRAGDAIGLAISSSAVGGIIGGIVLITLSPILAVFARSFSPPEFTMLAITGLIAIASVSDESFLKGLLAGCLGLLLATIGTDQISFGNRFTFDSYHMLNGFHLVSIVVGLFAISEMVFQFAGRDLTNRPKIDIVRAHFGSLKMALKHWKNLLRSSFIGTFFGILPGAGGVISSFVAYAAAKNAAKPDEKYGEGAEGGVVATESANNATVGGALVPSLALGIPGDAAAALLIATLLIFGFFPGPTLFEKQPDLVGAIFLVYLTSNVALLICGILLTPVFVFVLRVRKSKLIPLILLLCVVGTFALQSSIFDLWVMLGFGIVGIVLRIAKFPLSPVVIGVILGPLLENNLRRSLLISREGYWIFIDRPISATLLVVNVLLICWVIWSTIRKRKSARSTSTAPL